MKDQRTYPVEDIIRKFKIEGEAFACKPYGSGHINDTFILRNSMPSSPDYLLQRINHHVFKDVDTLMHNMWKVTTHLQEKLNAAKNSKVAFKTITLIPTHAGTLYYQDQEGYFWRMQTFIPNCISYDVVTSADQAFQSGKAFGKFQALLNDLPGKSLQETIPDFHNMESRFEKFQQAYEDDPLERKAAVESEIAFALERKYEMLELYKHVKNGSIPLRITHNDTKFNNVLLDEKTYQPLCVIDLDTVMPGAVLYDFGDAVRTIANTAAEDERELEKIQMNMEFYEAFAHGYLEETLLFLTEKEIELLPFSARYMTFIMGLRFLTDYLAGDVYYKTQSKAHNLQRARAQFKLLSCMERSYHDMVKVIKQLTQR